MAPAFLIGVIFSDLLYYCEYEDNSKEYFRDKGGTYH